MRNCSDIEGLLDDFVDGYLSQEETSQVERHLEGCARCRTEVHALRGLLEETRGLTRTIAPSRDLWGDIAKRIGDKPKAGNILQRFFGTASRASWSRVGVYAAAAAVLVLVFASYASLMGKGTAIPKSPGLNRNRLPSETPAVAKDDFGLMEEEYVQAKQVLMDAIEERETYWDKETVKIIEDNLLIIEGAIGDIHAAISVDPANKELNSMLLAMYEREMDFLYEASQIPVLPAGEEDEIAPKGEGGV